MQPRLEEVFMTNGIPTYTFVPPQEYSGLLLALRTPGRGVIIEGPSGIGKSTAVDSALRELNLGDHVTRVSARRRSDVENVWNLVNADEYGTVVVDDFHRLPDELRSALADAMKLLADEERERD